MFTCSLFTDAVSKADYLASKDWMAQNNEVEMILEGSKRGLVGDAFLSFGWMTLANYKQDGQRTGDGQNNGNTRQYSDTSANEDNSFRNHIR